MILKKLAQTVAFCFLSTAACAADFPIKPPSQLELDRAVMQAQMKAIVNRAMNLDAETAVRFWPLYDQYMAARMPVDNQTFDLISQYAKNYQKMNDNEAMTLITGLIQVQTAKNKVRADFVQKFYALLPGRVVARFFQVDNKLDAFLSANLGTIIPLVPTADMQALAGQNAPQVITAPKQ